MTYSHHEALEQLMGCRKRLLESMRLSKESGQQALFEAEMECLRATDEAMHLLAKLNELAGRSQGHG